MKDYFSILFKFIKDNIIFIILFLAYVSITYAFHIVNCPVKLLIGYPCPGCGMTRACISILKFDFVAAFNYNPMVFLLPFVLWIIIFKERPIIKKIYNSKILWISVLCIVILVYILRLIYIYPKIPLDYYENNLLALIINTIKKWL